MSFWFGTRWTAFTFQPVKVSIVCTGKDKFFAAERIGTSVGSQSYGKDPTNA